jgi:ABC-type multidrug transport system fused ATPase/permease subunit
VYFFKAMVLSPNWLQTRLANMSYRTQRSPTTIGLYAALVSVSFILCCVRDFLCHYFVIKSSKTLHGRMTEAVIKSPVLFFDTNPTGRIMNRFSRDIGIIDDVLSKQFDDAFSIVMMAVGVVILAVAVNLWLLVVLIPLFMFFSYIVLYYLKTSRELNRMAAIRYSPVYAHIDETIRGLEIIRTSQMEDEFINKLIRYKQVNQV